MSALLQRIMALGAGGAAPPPPGDVHLSILGFANGQDPRLKAIDFSTDPPTAGPSFTSFPPADVNAVAWSPNGRYLAVGGSGATGADFLKLYDCLSGTPVLMPSPVVVPNATIYFAAWSPDSRYLAVANGLSSSTKLFVYDWQTGSPVAVGTAVTQPAGVVARGMSWSVDSEILVVTTPTSPRIFFYKVVAGVLTKLANPATLPVANCFASWSPVAPYCAVVQFGAPRAMVYDCSSGSPVKMADPAKMPTISMDGVAWSSDGRYFLAGTLTNFGKLLVFDLSSGAITAIESSFNVAGNTLRYPYWIPGTHVVLVDLFTGAGLSSYEVVGGVLVDLGLVDGGRSNMIKVIGDVAGKNLNILWSGSTPYFTAYRVNSGVLTKITDPGGGVFPDPTYSARDGAFQPVMPT